MTVEDFPDDAPIVVSFGGGLNSTALLIGWVNAGMPPPGLILFADTGSELPETYEHVRRFSQWLADQGWEPPAHERFRPTDGGVITWVRKGGRQESLEEYSLRTRHLPSLAYGGKSCSHKFKIEPQNREVNNFPPAQKAWRAGHKVIKVLGYGAEEQKRIARAKVEDDKYLYLFPLAKWGWDREDCQRVILDAGLPLPPKSSCFFCPARKKHEIDRLAHEHPELVERAQRMEQVAYEAGNMRSTKGLGRQFSWTKYVNGSDLSDADAPNDSCMYCADEG